MGKYHCTIDLLFDWFGISCMTTDNFCFYLLNRLIQTSQTGGQLYSDASLFSIPCFSYESKRRERDRQTERKKEGTKERKEGYRATALSVMTFTVLLISM
jgi:hypothetical protein